MAILTKDDFLSKLKAKIGDDTSDEALQLIEDMTDTYNDLFTKSQSNSSGEDWKAKYEENDKMWREKYKERFFSGSDNVDPLPEPKAPEKTEDEKHAEEVSINDLFANPADKKG